ncbi:MAG: motility associated factor glycosyltransferase family protein, partial [Chlamydiia bacterium]|nr:motility associated factor glycosyltransferase family protein [Chlamydiia bacterium]
KEAEEWFSSLKLNKEVNVLFVYGVGLGYYFDAAKAWLDESIGHYLVFIEDDIEVMYRLMQTEKGSEILDHKQTQLHFLSGWGDADAMFQWLAWFFVLTCPEVSALQSYQRSKPEVFAELGSRIMHDSVFTDSIAAEYMRFGRSFFRNFYRNMLSLEHSFSGNALFDKFHNIPAIICGAGPSLNKNGELLASLGSRALIFAGGSSLNALSSRGMLPHFGAGIDPNPAQYERLINNYAYEVPFFYRNRMYWDAFRTIHGPRLYMTGAGGYDIAQWFDERLGIEGDVIDEGHNVVNFSVEIARRLGCNPIVFVGMDLSYTNMQAYADGVVTDTTVQAKDIQETVSADMAAFPRPDIYGNPVYTLWKWINESQWISDYAKEHKATQFINATEGGLGFEGVANMTLAEVKDQFLGFEFDLPALVHTEIQNATLPHVTTEKVLEGMQVLRQSLQRVVELSEGLIEEAHDLQDRIKRHHSVPENLQTGRGALFEEDLSEEPAYTKAIALCAQVCNKVLARRLFQIRYDKAFKNEQERNLERIKVNIEKYNFIKGAALLNLSVMEEAVQEHADRGYPIGDFLQKALEKVEQ